MKIVYHKDADAIQIVLSDKGVVESDETHQGVIIDYDAEGNPVGIEILDASKRTSNPNMMEYRVEVDAA
ncbi:MAG: DUF2283 domain-containing protein [bacterium]|nr:DUF2283 domain-containing protein [bacterium]